jgi:chromosome segregation ATPase
VIRVTPTPLITPRPLGIDIEGQQNELIVVKGMLTEHKRTIRAMDMSMEDLKGKIRTQDLVIAHKNEENQKATTRAVTLQRTLKSSQADATRYLQQSVTDTICLDQTKQKLSTSRQDVIDLQEKLRGKVADETKVAKQAKDEIALRSEELETLRNEMKLCAANNDDLQAPETIEQLHREIENLNADIRSLTANLEQCEDAYDEQVTLASRTAERRRRMPKRARSSSVSVEDNLYPVEKRLRINS